MLTVYLVIRPPLAFCEELLYIQTNHQRIVPFLEKTALLVVMCRGSRAQTEQRSTIEHSELRKLSITLSQTRLYLSRRKSE